LRYSGRLKASFEKPSSAEGKLKKIANLRKMESDQTSISNPNSLLPPPAPLKHHISNINNRLGNENEGLRKKASKDVIRNSRVGMAGVGRLIMGQNTTSTRSLSRDVPDYNERRKNSQSREEVAKRK
jgi:hypothetical protein